MISCVINIFDTLLYFYDSYDTNFINANDIILFIDIVKIISRKLRLWSNSY